jgi:hypothetical protein
MGKPLRKAKARLAARRQSFGQPARHEGRTAPGSMSARKSQPHKTERR